MSGDNEHIGVRTATEESICAVMAEACYACGGTPEEFKELMKKDSDLKKMYSKEPYFFKGGRARGEDAPSHESIDVYF